MRSPIPSRRTFWPGTLLIDYDDIANFTISNGGTGTPTTVNDTELFLEGSSSIRSTQLDTSFTDIKKTGLSLDMTGIRSVTLFYYAHENMPIESNLNWYFTSDASGLVNFFHHSQQTATNIKYNTQIGKGWNAWTILLSDLLIQGTPDWSNIQQIWVRADGVTNTHTWSIDSLYTDIRSTPQLCFVFDDANESDFTEAYDYMFTTNGIVGTSAIPSSLMDGGVQISTAQAKAMKADGWCFINHSSDAVELDTLTTQEALDNLAECRSYMQSNGLDTNGSSNMVVYPGGKYTSALIDEMPANGYTFGRIATEQSAPNSWINHSSNLAAQCINPYLFSLTETLDAAFNLSIFQTNVNHIVEYGGIGIVSAHGIVAAGATGIQSDRADFRAAVDYVIPLRDQGLLEIVTVEQALSRHKRS